MVPDGPDSFGALLRRHRLAAGLTQEALAERAGLSVRGLQDLERGARQPQAETLQRLGDALSLTGAERAAFGQAGAPRPREQKAGARAGFVSHDGRLRQHNLPAQLTSFIKRELESATFSAARRPTPTVVAQARPVGAGTAPGWAGPSRR